MSFWKSLFGGSFSPGRTAAETSAPEIHNGFTIRAAPAKNGPQFQPAGFIEKEIAGIRKEHYFIRADFFTAYDDAVAFSLIKARQIIDLKGERLFD
jgi:hypothetical protein